MLGHRSLEILETARRFHLFIRGAVGDGLQLLGNLHVRVVDVDLVFAVAGMGCTALHLGERVGAAGVGLAPDELDRG